MYEKFIKRLLDIIISLCSLIILMPIMLIIAILIKISLGSPIIIKQKRPGRYGKIFTLYKYRTMNNKRDDKGNLLPDNKRITKIGNFLRNYSLDELPEIFNILKGDMSIVGPRPLLVDYLEYYTEKELKRHDVRPGLTGLAQINGRNLTKWDERLQLDVRYVENITFKQDIKIMYKTIIKILKKEGVVIRQENEMKDLNEERKYKYYIKEMRLIDIVNNKTKIVQYIQELQKIANIKNNANLVFDNMCKFKKDGTANIIGAYSMNSNELLGLIWCYKRNEKLHINYFYIEEKYRNKGIGRKLINKVYKLARKLEIHEIELMVHIKNDNAIEFYKKQNFIGEERICLCKKL